MVDKIRFGNIGKITPVDFLLRFFIFYQQLMLNRLMGGRMVVFGGEEYQRSKGEIGLLFNGRDENDVQ